MHTLSIKRLGFAMATTWVLLYIGCVLVMATVPKEEAVRFFNSLLHGLDVSPIMRWEMPWTDMIMGVVETFILGWLFGAAIAALYNLGSGERTESQAPCK